MEPSDIYNGITGMMYDTGRAYLHDRTSDEIRALVAYTSDVDDCDRGDADDWIGEIAHDELIHRGEEDSEATAAAPPGPIGRITSVHEDSQGLRVEVTPHPNGGIK